MEGENVKEHREEEQNLLVLTETKNENVEENSDVIEKTIGILGKWQILVSLMVCVVKIPVAWQQLSIVFIAPPTTFTCLDNNTDQCGDNCTRHIFDRTIFSESIITEWDLVCERTYLKDLAQTVTMLGVLLGNVVFGYLSDKFGRRNPLIGGVLLQVVCSIGAAFSKWFILFLVLRFLAALATGGTMVMSFVLVMEIIGAKWRTTIGILYQLPFSLGHVSLPLFAYFLRDWKHLQLAISVPPILLISYFWILPESPRWLLTMGRKDDAVKILENAASVNKLHKEDVKKHVDFYSRKSGNERDKNGNFWDLVRTPIMRTYTFCIGFNWFSAGICFFGGAQYIGQLGGNIFINVAFSAIIQIPATLFSIYTLQAWGRKRTLIIFNLISAVSCFLIGVVPQNLPWLRTLLASINLCGMAVVFPGAYIYSGELFPTVVRNIGVGTSSMFARIGSMIAPFVAGLVVVQEWLPVVVFGVMPLIGAVLCGRLPETVGCKLPDTIEEAEKMDGRSLKKDESK